MRFQQTIRWYPNLTETLKWNGSGVSVRKVSAFSLINQPCYFNFFLFFLLFISYKYSLVKKFFSLLLFYRDYNLLIFLFNASSSRISLNYIIWFIFKVFTHYFYISNIIIWKSNTRLLWNKVIWYIIFNKCFFI